MHLLINSMFLFSIIIMCFLTVSFIQNFITNSVQKKLVSLSSCLISEYFIVVDPEVLISSSSDHCCTWRGESRLGRVCANSSGCSCTDDGSWPVCVLHVGSGKLIS